VIFGFYTLYLGSMVTDASWRGSATRSFDLTALATPFSRRLNLKYFFVPLSMSAPIYIVGLDFGRWFAITCINYMLIMLSREVVSTELEYSRFSRGNTEPRSGVVSSSVPTLGFYGNLVVLLSILLFLRLPHFCLWSCLVLEQPLATIVELFLRAFG